MISTASPWRLAPVLAAVGLGAALLAARPIPLQEAPALEAHKADIARMTADGGVMLTSNERYQAEDGGITHFGQHFEAIPGGLDARGCLWGEREGQVLGIYWYFFTGWDPVTEQGFLYQSSPNGRVGFGHGGPVGTDGHWSEQRFAGAGMPPRGRHENQWFATDSVITRSFNAELGGEWRENRTYTWVRRTDRAPPC